MKPETGFEPVTYRLQDAGAQIVIYDLEQLVDLVSPAGDARTRD
jgi:hypothetical protein